MTVKPTAKAFLLIIAVFAEVSYSDHVVALLQASHGLSRSCQHLQVIFILAAFA